MVACFADGEQTIVTGATVVHDTSMIKCPGDKARGLVARVAILGCWHMVWRRRFSSGSCAIVACVTVIYDALVIKPGTCKGRGVMAHRAILGRRKMAVMHDGCYCACASVAGHAVINDTGMIEHCCHKGAGYVTETAVLGGRDVAGILLGHRPCRIITMTFSTVISPAGMVKGSIRETHGVMTYTAILSRGRMWRRRIRHLS